MNWIKSNVVMLPSNEKATDKPFSIGITLCNDGILRWGNPVGKTESRQHLYFTSDEEIKEGDWFMSMFMSFPLHNVEGGYAEYPDTNGCKKIIATTDKNLKLYEEEVLASASGFTFKTSPIYLPEPSKEFLEVYVKAYNEGKKIDEVLVEQEDFGEEYWEGDDYSGQPIWREKLQVKVKPGNTITIKKVKDSWSREEVTNLLFTLAGEMYKTKTILGPESIENWIKQNL